MTDEASAPHHPASPDDAQASLRAGLSDQITRAQSQLETQLQELLHSPAGRDVALTEKLRGQLHVLQAIGQSLNGADAASLVQLSAEVSTLVTASQSIAEQAQAEIASAASAEATMRAEYITATTEIDRQVAGTMAADCTNNALAHAMAKRFGIDLTDYDKEREDIARKRAEAGAHGDKIGERQADVLLAQNTYDAMAASVDKIKDPEERRRYLQQMQEQQENIARLRHALEQQLELDARQKAQRDGLSPKETEAAVAAAKTEGMVDADRLAHNLKGADEARATQLRLEAAVKSAQGDKTDTPALNHVDAALSPQAQAAAQMAATAISAGQDSFTASLSLDGSQQVALSTAPDAHTKVDVPSVAKATGSSSQGLA